MRNLLLSVLLLVPAPALACDIGSAFSNSFSQIIERTEVINVPQIIERTEVINVPQIITTSEVINVPQVFSNFSSNFQSSSSFNGFSGFNNFSRHDFLRDRGLRDAGVFNSRSRFNGLGRRGGEFGIPGGEFGFGRGSGFPSDVNPFDGFSRSESRRVADASGLGPLRRHALKGLLSRRFPQR